MTKLFPRIVASLSAVSLLLNPIANQPLYAVCDSRVISTSVSHPYTEDQAVVQSLKSFYGHAFSRGWVLPYLLETYKSVKTTTAAWYTRHETAIQIGGSITVVVGLTAFLLSPLSAGISAGTRATLWAAVNVGIIGFVAASSAKRVWPLDPKNRQPKVHDRVFEHLLEGVGPSTADWHRISVVMESILAVATTNAPIIRLTDVEADIHAHLSAQGLDIEDLSPLFSMLEEARLLVSANGGYRLGASPEVIAVKLKVVSYISVELSNALEGTIDNLAATIKKYSEVSESWPLSPVESRWAFLQAASLLSPAHKEQLVNVLKRHHDLRAEFPLADSLWLMLGQAPGQNWLAEHAPYLLGRTIYTTAPEGWFAAGGLGRVQQYHAAGMERLVGDRAKVVTIEAYYPDDYGDPNDFNDPKHPRPEGWERVHFGEPIMIPVLDRGEVEAEVYRYTRPDGIIAYFIRDTYSYYTKRRYSYGANGSGTFEEFSEFFCRANLELIKRLEEADQKSRRTPIHEAYKPPVIIANDGQMGRIPRMRRHVREFQQSDIMQNALIWMVTHTYGNRGKFFTEDATSVGISDADGASAVAAVHRDEVGPWDPFDRVVAITNGDDRQATREAYLRIWKELFGIHGDPEHPTPEQIYELKRKAKQEFRVPADVLMNCGLDPSKPVLDPDLPVLEYSGRLVWEKAGQDRAFTVDNLTKMVLEENMQVVLYVNVQVHTQGDFDKLAALARALNTRSTRGGRLIVRTGWGLVDQRALLVAADAQMQDSHRKTEAAGYTEADISSVGGIPMGPPWLEGIIQRQGLIIDRTKPGVGNTLIPADGSPEAYMNAFRWLRRQYRHDDGTPNDVGRKNLAAYQATSVRLSQPLAADITAAEYLRQLSLAVERKENPMELVRQYIAGEPEVVKYFRKPWVRAQLAGYLARADNRSWATPLRDGNSTILAYVIHLPEKRPFVLAVNVEDIWYPIPLGEKRWLTVPFTGNEEAFHIVFNGSNLDPNTSFEVWDLGEKKMYPRQQTMANIWKNGWKIGVPYPGVQALEPVLLDTPEESLEKQAAYKGLPMSLNGSSGKTFYLRDVPELPGLRNILSNEGAIAQTLRYMLTPRTPSSFSGDRAIMQVPVRFLGGLGKTFMPRLRELMRKVTLPKDSIIHLVGVHPTGLLAEYIMNPELKHTTISDRENDFYQVPISDSIDGWVIVREAMRGEPGFTASMYSVTNLTGNLSTVAADVKALHADGYRAIVDATGHLAADSPLILEHPEWFLNGFRHLESFHDGIHPDVPDTEVIDKTDGWGYLAYIPDDEFRMSKRLLQWPEMTWGRKIVDGKPYVRVLLRHHSGLGPMTNTVALNFNLPEVQQWFIGELRRWVVEADIDGFRFDLADRLPDTFWNRVKEELHDAKRNGRPLVYVHEDYRWIGEKAAVSAATVRLLTEVPTETGDLLGTPVAGLVDRRPVIDAYYNKELFEHFRDRTREWGHYAGLIRNLLPLLQRGGFTNYLETHDEVLPMGRLRGAMIGAYLALLTLVFTLPGLPSFYFPSAFGWRWYNSQGHPEDVKRELSYEEFVRRAESERKTVLPEFSDVLTGTDHPIFRDGRAAAEVVSSNSELITYVRTHDDSVFGPELALVALNLSGGTQNSVLSVPLDTLKLDESEEHYFMLYDLIGKQIFFYTASQLKHLELELDPWERRVFLVREIVQPSEEFRHDFDRAWTGLGMKISMNEHYSETEPVHKGSMSVSATVRRAVGALMAATVFVFAWSSSLVRSSSLRWRPLLSAA